MLKADIVLNDDTVLVNVMLFKSREFSNSQITSEKEAEQVLSNNDNNIFFCGKYVQGCLIPKQISEYYLYDDSKDLKAKLVSFVDSLSTIYDKTDMADFIFDYRDEILELIK